MENYTLEPYKTSELCTSKGGELQINETTYLLTSWCRALLEKLTGLQLVKKFPAFHGTRRFITALTSVRHLSLSWANPVQSIYPHPTSCRSILILSTHLWLGLPSGLLPSGFPSKTLYTPSPHPYAPHAQPISLDQWDICQANHLNKYFFYDIYIWKHIYSQPIFFTCGYNHVSIPRIDFIEILNLSICNYGRHFPCRVANMPK